MADFSRYLPLSQRAQVDESGVSNDWRPFVAQRLVRLASNDAAWDAPARGGGTVGSVLSALIDRLGSSRRQRFAARLGVGADAAELEPATARAALASFASQRASGTGPHGVAELVAVVAAELAVGGGIGLPARVSGAVALHLSLAAPLPIRAAIRDRALIASDAGWRFGTGTPLEAPAEELLAFLCGLAPLPE
ncbi:hypothetical protein HQQ80_15910 [Microbacteriaceae bacterium VKM Ac-2855]|nr:hypothetical protein [Microbacteriaceae bacterium VKM Ac-2855]